MISSAKVIFLFEKKKCFVVKQSIRDFFCYKTLILLFYKKSFSNFAPKYVLSAVFRFLYKLNNSTEPFMCKRYIILLFTLIISFVATMAATKKFTLVIDAGHGGHDAGAVGAISKEKNINLNTALAFGRYVERNCPDVNVIYTRKTDVFVTLQGRADIANRAKADLFISIHTNAQPAGYKTAKGLETYTLGMHRANDNLDVAKRENGVILVEKDYKERYQGFDPNSAESYIIFEFMQDKNMQRSVELARLVQKNVCSIAGRPNKGVKQAGFLVLRQTSMPSCLIELGFISTPSDEQYLNDAGNIDKLAQGIFQAFVAYKAKVRGEVSEASPPALSRREGADSVIGEEKRDERGEKRKEGREKRDERREVRNERKEVREEKVEEASEPIVERKDTDAPLFKVQIFVADRTVKRNDARLKGEHNADHYKEGGSVKYTLGASTNYNEIYRMRKNLLEKFPDCFIVAFKDGEKMNINEAIREFKQRRGR